MEGRLVTAPFERERQALGAANVIDKPFVSNEWLDQCFAGLLNRQAEDNISGISRRAASPSNAFEELGVAIGL